MNEEKYWKMPDWIRMNMISKEGAFTMAKVFITLTGTNIILEMIFLKRVRKSDWRKSRIMSMTRKQSKLLMKALEKSGMWRTVPILLLVNR